MAKQSWVGPASIAGSKKHSTFSQGYRAATAGGPIWGNETVVNALRGFAEMAGGNGRMLLLVLAKEIEDGDQKAAARTYAKILPEIRRRFVPVAVKDALGEEDAMGIMTQGDAEVMIEEMLAYERGEHKAPIEEALKDAKTLLGEMKKAFRPVLSEWMKAHRTLVHSLDFRSPRHWPGRPGIPQDAEQISYKVNTANEAILDISAHLDNLQHVVNAQGMGEELETQGELTEAAGKSFWDYLVGAQEAFLNDAAKAIKKLAGGYAESVKVVRARSAVWLEYKGQDRSDMDMEATITLIVKEPDIHVHMDVKSVMHASWTREVQYKSGQLTTDNVVNLFQEAFGR